MDDHKYIYLQPEFCADDTYGRLWCQDPDPEDCEDGKHWTKYVRFDIAQSREQELEAEVDQLVGALQQALENLNCSCSPRDRESGHLIDCHYPYIESIIEQALAND